MPVVVINDDSSDDDEFKLPSLLRRVASPVKVRRAFTRGPFCFSRANERLDERTIRDADAHLLNSNPSMTAETIDDARARKPADAAETRRGDASVRRRRRGDR
jgi:hypothetical protein